MSGSRKSNTGHTVPKQSIVKGNATAGSAAISPEAASVVVPRTVTGQRHISPVGRHSQQTHRLAGARAEALGLTTVRELYEHDRNVVLGKLQKTSDGIVAQQRNEQARRSGTPTDKT
jgi:hypothetical protein